MGLYHRRGRSEKGDFRYAMNRGASAQFPVEVMVENNFSCPHGLTRPRIPVILDSDGAIIPKNDRLQHVRNGRNAGELAHVPLPVFLPVVWVVFRSSSEWVKNTDAPDGFLGRVFG